MRGVQRKETRVEEPPGFTRDSPRLEASGTIVPIMFLTRDAMNMMVLGHLINHMITTNSSKSLPLAGEMDCHTNQ